MSATKEKKDWVVLRVAGVMLVARKKDVLPKNRLSPPLTYEQAQAFKNLFK